MKSTVIILGTSNVNGNTEKLIVKINVPLKADVINLSDYNISEYDYENKNISDDFIPLISEIVEKYDQIIFATPVYWYSTSTKLKIFIDRLTDIITVRKDIGRKLRGKQVGIVTSSIGENLADDFWLPLVSTFEYLGMEVIYKEHFIEDDISEFELNTIFKTLSK